MITMPPTILTHGVEKSTLPIQPAVAPSSTKMSETPALKASELMMTARRADERDSPPWPFKCSTLTPEMSEMYPGTSGSTHGVRNDRIPATNAMTMVMLEPSIAVQEYNRRVISDKWWGNG